MILRDSFGNGSQRCSLTILGRPVFPHAVKCDIGSQGCEPFGESSAKTASRPRDERYFACKHSRIA